MNDTGGFTVNLFWVLVVGLNFLFTVVAVVLAIMAVRWFLARARRTREISDLRSRVERLELESERAMVPGAPSEPGRGGG